MANGTGFHFTTKIGMLPKSTFVVVSFSLKEKLNDAFVLTLEMVSHIPDITSSNVLNYPCELQVWLNGEIQRCVHGVASSFVQKDVDVYRTRYDIEVRPALWRLSLDYNTRIFQNKMPKDIISFLLQEAGITDYVFTLRRNYDERKCHIQYRETNLAFVNRVVAEEGILYFHEFEGGKHRLVFFDDIVALIRCPSLLYNPNSNTLAHENYAYSFRYRTKVHTSKAIMDEYNVKSPPNGSSLRCQGPQKNYQPNTYQHHNSVIGIGKSNCAALLPGHRFTMSCHPNPACNIDWQVIGVIHSGELAQAWEEEGSNRPTSYQNTIEVVPATHSWRPLTPNKPKTEGPHVATTISPRSEEIDYDANEWVKLQFPWAVLGSSNDQYCCWARVGYSSADDQRGFMPPPAGHKVIVSFLDGDPSQPIVTGYIG